MGVNMTNFNLQQFSEFIQFYRDSYRTISMNKCTNNSNIIERFKKGNKIKIKKQNKGTFTKWCGGNVTKECIQRGKNSPNPKIRKKAVFAENARKFKH